MSSRLLAATLLAVGLAGTASAAQLKAPEVLLDAATHDATVVDLALCPLAMKADAEVWSTTESWTILSAPAQRSKAFVAVSVTDDAAHAGAVPAPKPPALTDANGALPRLVLGGRSTDKLDDAFLGGGGVFEHLPDGKLLQVH